MGSFRVKSLTFQEIPHDPSHMFPKKILKIPQFVLITHNLVMLNVPGLNFFQAFPFFTSVFNQSFHDSTCKSYAYRCKIVTFRAL